MKINFQGATLQLAGQHISVDGVQYRIRSGAVKNFGSTPTDVCLIGNIELYGDEEAEEEEEEEDEDTDCECDLCVPPPTERDTLEMVESNLPEDVCYQTPVGEYVTFNGEDYRLESASLKHGEGGRVYRRV